MAYGPEPITYFFSILTGQVFECGFFSFLIEGASGGALFPAHALIAFAFVA
jgi:hypothetical protein